jgi:hypothetical protein
MPDFADASTIKHRSWTRQVGGKRRSCEAESGKLQSQIKRTPPEGRVKAAKQKLLCIVFIDLVN